MSMLVYFEFYLAIFREISCVNGSIYVEIVWVGHTLVSSFGYDPSFVADRLRGFFCILISSAIFVALW